MYKNSQIDFRGFLFCSKKWYNSINLNYKIIFQMPRKKLFTMRKTAQFRFIYSMNNLVGSWFFLVIHIIWFWIWLAWDLDINMLTMIVSLEAIILMILLLMAQNRQGIKDNIRDEADLQADLNSLETGKEILEHVAEIKKEIRKLKNKK